jgi:hypothetical protein
MNVLEAEIREQQSRLHINNFSLTFGQLLDLYDQQRFIIPKEYQNCFSWDVAKQTIFIEHLLIGFPVRPILVVENRQQQWELIDGVQRMLTVFAFFGRLKHIPTINNLVLTKGQFIAALNGIGGNNMPIFVAEQIRSKTLSVNSIRWDSDIELLAEIFKQGSEI